MKKLNQVGLSDMPQFIIKNFKRCFIKKILYRFEDDVCLIVHFQQILNFHYIYIYLQPNVVSAAYNHQASSGLHSLLESQQSMVEKVNARFPDPYFDALSSSKFV